MDLLTIIQTVLRRWYVTLPVLLATFGLAFYVQTNIPSEYEARGSVLLEEPRFDPSRLPASFVNAGAIIDRFEESDAATTLAAGDVQVGAQARDSTTLEVTALGSDSNDVESSTMAAMDWISTEVAALQQEENVAEEERLRVSVLTPVVTAEPQPGGSFEAVGVVILRDPASGTDNPYSAGGGTTSLLQAVATSDTGRARVNRATASGVGFDLSVSRDNSAIISITTTGPNPAGVINAFDVVREVLAEELDSRQERADVPGSRRILITDLARPEVVRDVSPPLSRAVAAIVGAGGLTALGLAIAVESIVSRRRPEPAWTEDRAAVEKWWTERIEPTPAQLDERLPNDTRAESEATAGVDERR